MKTLDEAYEGVTLPIDLLHSLFRYEPETGRLIRKTGIPGGGVGKPGDEAGCDQRGYRKVTINYRPYMVHRIVWALVHGAWPRGDIDHINGIRSDNRLCNLRCVPKAINRQNIRRAYKTNVSGLLGAHKRGNWFTSSIKANGKLIRLGRFDTAQEAHEAYLEAKRKYHEGCTI